MATDRNKIVTTLSPEDLQAFLDECWKTKGLTLAKIQELAATRGISISLMAATSFRDSTWKRHLDRIKRARELKEQVAELKSVPGGSLMGAASEILATEVFDALSNPDPDSGLDLDVLSKIVKRLRDGDRADNESTVRIAALESQLKEREAKDADRRAKADAAKLALTRQKSGGITAETKAAIMAALDS